MSVTIEYSKLDKFNPAPARRPAILTRFKNAAFDWGVDTRNKLWKKDDPLRQLNTTLKTVDIINNGLGVYSALLDDWNIARMVGSFVGATVGVILLNTKQDMTIPDGKTLFTQWKNALKNPSSPMFFGSAIGIPMAVPGHLSELYYGTLGGRPEQLLQLVLGLVIDISGVRFLFKFINDKRPTSVPTQRGLSFAAGETSPSSATSFLSQLLKTTRKAIEIAHKIIQWAEQKSPTRPFVMAGQLTCKRVNQSMQSRHTGFAIGQGIIAFKLVEATHVCLTQSASDGRCMMTNIAIALAVGWGNKALTEMMIDRVQQRDYFYSRFGTKLKAFPQQVRLSLKAGMKEMFSRHKSPLPKSTMEDINSMPRPTLAMKPSPYHPVMLGSLHDAPSQ